jgi:hypothetical protein
MIFCLPMDENDEPNNPARETPAPEVEKLLKILELQSAGRRRPALAPSSSFRYGSLLAIAIFAFGSLGMLEWFLSSLPKPHPVPAPPGQPVKTGTAAGTPKNP